MYFEYNLETSDQIPGAGDSEEVFFVGMGIYVLK